MYEAFFQLSERPFTTVPRIEHYFPAEAIEQARQTLTRCIERGEGPALVVGPAGCGKSMLAHVLAAQFHGEYGVVLLNQGHLRTARELLQSILFELGLPYRKQDEGELRLALMSHATRSDRYPQGLLLLVDEAHTLSLRVLEELRLVTNVVRAGQPRVRLVLFGGGSLEERFANPKLESFGQRLAARLYLRAWNHAETTQFVLGALSEVGGHGDRIFRADAIDALYRASEGIPRLLIQLCDHALSLAFAGGQTSIGAAGIEEAWADLQQLPAPWNESPREAKIDVAAADSPAVIEFGGLDGEDEPEADLEPATIHTLPLRAFDQVDDDFEVIEASLEDLQGEFVSDAIEATAEMAIPREEPAPPTHTEVFAEEELLLDRYGALDARLSRHRVTPQQSEARQLSELITALCSPGAELLPAAPVEAKPQPAIEQPAAAALDATANLPRATTFYADDVAITTFEPMASDTALDPVYPENSSITTLAAAFSRPVAAARGTRASAADDDLIIVEEDLGSPIPRTEASAGAWRQDYRELFSRLRRG
ncbi:MAG: AAA family ATPase [Pirellulales bacterium]|nr:AAA family ATPase [Pirellulales bacterium]